MTSKSQFKWRQFLPEIILWGVRWYCLYPISYRQLEEMMCDRGVEVDHTTLRALGAEVRTRIRQAVPVASETNQRFVAGG